MSRVVPLRISAYRLGSHLPLSFLNSMQMVRNVQLPMRLGQSLQQNRRRGGKLRRKHWHCGWWDGMLSPISVRVSVYLNIRPQAVDYQPQSTSCNTHFGRCSVAARGHHVNCLPLQNSVPQHKGTSKCSWVILLASTLHREQKYPRMLPVRSWSSPSFTHHCS